MLSQTTDSGDAPPQQRPLGAGWWLAIVAAFLLLYGLTTQRTVSWQDSGMFQWRVLEGDFTGRLGLALAHPLYIAAGRMLLWIGGSRNLPLLMNLLSALGMAVALANLSAIGSRLTGRRGACVLVATVLGLCHTAWWLSTIAEVYTWSLAGLTMELYFLVRLLRRPDWRLLAGLSLASGLGLSIHNFALLPLPVYAVVTAALLIRRRLSAWSLLPAMAAYLLGAGLYLEIITASALQSGDVGGAIRSALVGNYGSQVTNVGSLSKYWKENIQLSGMNFLNPLLPLAVVGWVRFRRKLGGPLAAALGGVTLIEIVFFLRYPVPDQFTFILPSLAMIAAAAMVGLDEVACWGRGWRIAAWGLCGLSLVAQPTFYSLAPSLARRLAGPAPQRQVFRDEWRYWLAPWKQNEDSAQRFAETALREAEPGAVIVPDSTSESPLLLVQKLENLRGDIKIAVGDFDLSALRNDPGKLRNALAGRTMYVVSCPFKSFPPTALFHWEEGQVLYRLHWDGNSPPDQK